MITKFKATPVALAVAALFASPLAFANDNGNGDYRDGVRISYHNETDVELKTEWKLENDVEVEGRVSVTGVIPVNAESGAMVDTKQQSVGQTVGNNIVDNDAVVHEDALRGAQGNLGLNVSAGDNNAQSNDAALSAVDAAQVFANAQSFGYQKAGGNGTLNYATRNRAILGGNALQGAQGNIGVNITAGNSNVQANALAASVNDSGTLAKASSYTNQHAAGNQTANVGDTIQFQNVLNVNLGASLNGGYSGSGSGTYSGTNSGSTGAAYQMNNFYLDTWSGSLPHPSGSTTGHLDMDNAIQNAVANPLRSGVGGIAFDVVTPRSTEAGNLGFNESGNIALQGTVSGQVVFLQTEFRPHLNTAVMGGNALSGAQGNIGVNISAGTNNLQRNSLAISAARGNGGGTPGGGELLR